MTFYCPELSIERDGCVDCVKYTRNCKVQAVPQSQLTDKQMQLMTFLTCFENMIEWTHPNALIVLCAAREKKLSITVKV